MNLQIAVAEELCVRLSRQCRYLNTALLNMSPAVHACLPCKPGLSDNPGRPSSRKEVQDSRISLAGRSPCSPALL